MSITVKYNEKGERVGVIHRIDDHCGEGPRHHERRNRDTIGNYERYVEMLSEFGPFNGDELSLLFNRRKHAIYTAMRFLERKRIVRKIGYCRSLPGKPVPIFAAASTSERTASSSFGDDSDPILD